MLWLLLLAAAFCFIMGSLTKSDSSKESDVSTPKPQPDQTEDILNRLREKYGKR